MEQRCVELSKRHRMYCMEQFVTDTPYGFRFREAIQPLTALIPQHNALLQVPDKNGFVGQFKQLRLVSQRLLGLYPSAEIVHNAGEHTVAVQVHLAHGQRDRERGAIPAPGADFTPNADDFPLTALEIPRQIAIVLLMIGRGHEQTDVLSNHVGGGIPKEALGRRVDRLNEAALIDGDNPVHCSLQNGGAAGFTVAQRHFGHV
jgi:hypothetical protein